MAEECEEGLVCGGGVPARALETAPRHRGLVAAGLALLGLAVLGLAASTSASPGDGGTGRLKRAAFETDGVIESQLLPRDQSKDHDGAAQHKRPTAVDAEDPDEVGKPGAGMPGWLVPMAVVLLLSCLCLLALARKCVLDYMTMQPGQRAMQRCTPVCFPEQPLWEPQQPPPEQICMGSTRRAPEVSLVFDDQGTARTVCAKFRPLGVKHLGQAPIVVRGFVINSYAKLELGVREGWRLTHVGGEDLKGSTNFEEVEGRLYDHLRDLPVWPLPLQFKVEGASEPRVIKFLQRPLGLGFDTNIPTVNRVYDSTPAQREGVQLGWRLTRIGDQRVHESQSSREVLQYLREAVEPLQEAD